MSIPYPTGYDLEYISTDRDAAAAGCHWGLVLQQHGSDIWVLTSIGVRYYGVPSEHVFVRRGDSGYDIIDMCWRFGVSHAAYLQGCLPGPLRRDPVIAPG